MARRLQCLPSAQARPAHMMLALRRLRRVRLDQQAAAHGARQRLAQVRHQAKQIGQVGRVGGAIRLGLQDQPSGRDQQTGGVHPLCVPTRIPIGRRGRQPNSIYILSQIQIDAETSVGQVNPDFQHTAGLPRTQTINWSDCFRTNWLVCLSIYIYIILLISYAPELRLECLPFFAKFVVCCVFCVRSVSGFG